MKLYHGTSEKAARQILAGAGIRPRGKKSGNWKHTIESHPECVYLTTAYAPYFAHMAAPPKGERVAVLEVDTNLLNPFSLLPDEDFLGQAVRKRADNPDLDLPEAWDAWDIMKKTRWFRRRLEHFQPSWEISVKGLGNCCFKGTVPASAITRIATWEPEETPFLYMMSMDPMVSIMNYQIVGNKYRGLVKWLFKDDLGEDAPVEQFKAEHAEAILAETDWTPQMFEQMRWSYHLPSQEEQDRVIVEQIRAAATDAA